MSTTAKTENPTKVVIGKVRFSYAQVFEPKAMEEGGKAKYSVSILIPKKDKVTVAKVQKAIAAAAEAGLSSKFMGKMPKEFDTLKDGDDKEDEVYAGHFYLSAKSDNKPQVVDADLNHIIDADEFYSGCYGRASVNFYAYNFNGKKGIACGLNNLQKLEDGEPLGGGRSSAESDFGDDELM